ncbi:VOC family protein [Alteromonadaceae bacterium M269]|nr:VOC family protein [Alteromonadaceae bacterium M269]
MNSTLEHINVTLNDIDTAAKVFQDIFGWHIRWEGEAKNQGRTIHIGAEDSYLALYTHGDSQKQNTSYKTVGHLNHIGIVVEDLDATEVLVKEAGFSTHSHGDYEPGRRFYFDIEDDVEIEVVSYKN